MSKYSQEIMHMPKMKLHLGSLTCCLVSVIAATSGKQACGPNTRGLPYHSEGRDIIDRSGSAVTLTGLNWAAHQEAMIPEGLQYNSIRNITTMVKELGFSIVRLTFATEMIDDIYDNDMEDITIADSLTGALGEANGTKILNQILEHNPEFSETTTRLEAFDALASELSRQDIILQLDNHVSKAIWCCDAADGNAWFGDTYFDPIKWKRGLVYMAKHAKRWRSFGIIGLRNEFRKPVSGSPALPWNWFVWYQYMTEAAAAINEANSVPLLSMMGMPWVSTLVNGDALTGANGTGGTSHTAKFYPGQFSWSDKVILENHRYDTTSSTTPNCTAFIDTYLSLGFDALDETAPVTHRWPVILGEWGFPQDGKYYKEREYPICLKQFYDQFNPTWMYWTLAGSYYSFTKHGEKTIQDSDDTYGILNHEWTEWRSSETVETYFGSL